MRQKSLFWTYYLIGRKKARGRTARYREVDLDQRNSKICRLVLGNNLKTRFFR